MKRLAFIIPARMSSSRLPGKCCLEVIPDLTIIELVFLRLEFFFPGIPKILLTSTSESDDVLVDLVRRKLDVEIIRGDLHDVASRLLLIKEYSHVIRINGDNIYLNPDYIQKAIDLVLNSNFQFISNVKVRTFPPGHSVEIADLELFTKHYSKFSSFDKEHIFSFFYSNWESSLMYSFESDKLLSHIKLALDTHNDFIIAKKYYSDKSLLKANFNFLKYDEAKTLSHSGNWR